jgi:hypothetical protein
MPRNKRPPVLWHMALLALLSMIVGILLAAALVDPHRLPKLKPSGLKLAWSLPRVSLSTLVEPRKSTVRAIRHGRKSFRLFGLSGGRR